MLPESNIRKLLNMKGQENLPFFFKLGLETVSEIFTVNAPDYDFLIFYVSLPCRVEPFPRGAFQSASS